MNEGLDLPSPAEMKAWHFEVTRGCAQECMREVLDKAADAGAEVLVIDGDMVFGADHVASAVFHASRAIEEGRNSSDSLTMEALLYASGERQLGRAISKMSVNDETTRIVVALLSGRDFRASESWSPLPPVDRCPDNDRYVRFGITHEELGTVQSERRIDLVLERVAAVDLLKR